MTDTANPAPLPPTDPIRRTLLWNLVQHLCQFLCAILFELRVYGVYNIPQHGGVLIVSNHQSYLDPILLSVRLDRPLSYLAKSELFKNRFFGWFIRSLNAFPVSQGSGDIGAVKESISRLQGGHVLNVFPEGSRSEDGHIAPLEKGFGLLVRRAKVPVVPVVIDGSFRAWPRGRKFPRPWKIRIMVGRPIDELWKLDRDHILEKIDGILREMYDDLRAGKIPPNPPRPRGR